MGNRQWAVGNGQWALGTFDKLRLTIGDRQWAIVTHNHSPFTIHLSLFTTHHSPLTIHHSPFKLFNTILKNSNTITVYTDGAARGNPGAGGYGVVLIWGNITKELSKGYRLTTNNRMELMAVIAALEALKKNNLDVVIYSDSNYVVKAIEEGWLQKWIKTDFKGGKKNKDLWLRFNELSLNHTLKFKWVKGHALNPHNNRCDILATEAADGNNLFIDEGYEESSK
jgi:ribonuclease HI